MNGKCTAAFGIALASSAAHVSIPQRELPLDIATVLAISVEYLVLVRNEIHNGDEVPERCEEFVLRSTGRQYVPRVGITDRPVFHEQREILVEAASSKYRESVRGSTG